MKITLNQRSTDELVALLERLDIRSPSHLVQLLITKEYKTVHSPSVEEVIYEQRSKEKEA